MVQRRNSRQRELVLDAVQCLKCHPTANQVYAYVHEKDDHVSMGTVYRNLNLLEETGDIISIEVPGGNRFDRRCDPHAHVICCSCGVVCDAMVEHDHTVDGMAERQTGYIITRHETLFYGICPSCQEKKVQNEDAQASA